MNKKYIYIFTCFKYTYIIVNFDFDNLTSMENSWLYTYELSSNFLVSCTARLNFSLWYEPCVTAVFYRKTVTRANISVSVRKT